MIEEFKKIQSNKKDLRNFGLLIGSILFLFGVYIYYKHNVNYIYIISLGLLLIIFGLIVPKILKPFQKIWMGTAIILGFIITHVILILFFYLCVTPLSLIAKIFNKKFSDLSFKNKKNKSNTYWECRKDNEDSENRLEKQF